MVLDHFRLDGSKAMVTGASRGLGRAMTEALAEAGADVAVVARSGSLAHTEQAIRAAGRDSLGVHVLQARSGGSTLRIV